MPRLAARRCAHRISVGLDISDLSENHQKNRFSPLPGITTNHERAREMGRRESLISQRDTVRCQQAAFRIPACSCVISVTRTKAVVGVIHALMADRSDRHQPRSRQRGRIPSLCSSNSRSGRSPGAVARITCLAKALCSMSAGSQSSAAHPPRQSACAFGMSGGRSFAGPAIQVP